MPLDQFAEVVEKRGDVMRTGTGFRVTLEAEGRRVGELKALQRTVEERFVCGTALAGSVFASTAKPWFWLVMYTCRERKSTTGWFAP